MIGKTLPYLVMSFASALLIILVAMALFDLPMRGSWSLLSAVASACSWSARRRRGCSSRRWRRTQQVAFQLALLSSFLPTFILSGFIFPISSMPTAMQVITYVVPARYFIVALRAIVLKGAGLDARSGTAIWWRWPSSRLGDARRLGVAVAAAGGAVATEAE